MTKYIGKSLLIENNNEKILVIGDLHLGYQGSLRESGYQIPIKLYEQTISDLDSIFNKIKDDSGKKDEKIIDKVVILGDLKHEFGKILREEWKEVLDFLDYLDKKCKKTIIVKGNHDIFAEFIAKKKGISVVDYYLLGGIAFLHGDRDFPFIWGKEIKIWVIGHAHPAIVLEDKSGGVKKEKYKCFLEGKYKGKKIIVVPSFLPLNEGTDVRSGYDLGLAWDFNLDKFDVRVVGEDLGVLDFGKLGKI